MDEESMKRAKAMFERIKAKVRERNKEERKLTEEELERRFAILDVFIVFIFDVLMTLENLPKVDELNKDMLGMVLSEMVNEIKNPDDPVAMAEIEKIMVKVGDILLTNYKPQP